MRLKVFSVKVFQKTKKIEACRKTTLTITNHAFNIIDFKCPSDMYQCDNGECIGQSLVCDGDKTCADSSDEIYCKCLTEQSRCERSGECVDTRHVCNGISDCEDSSDEKDCRKLLIIY